MFTASTIDFLEHTGSRRPWVVGGMAYGISGIELVEGAARAGSLAFYGAAGLTLARVERDLARLDPALPIGVNVAHHDGESALLGLVRRYGFRQVEVSGFLRPTPAILGHRFGRLRGARPRRVFAKLSRISAAAAWMAPPAPRVLARAVSQGLLSSEDAERAHRTPCADGLVLEGDSGGHTDRRCWLPLLAAARAMRAERPVWIGVAGGIGTPEAVAGALAAGADFVLGGSVHQSCVESGVRPEVRRWLEDADLEDFAYTASAVWFGTPARVQVLARPGTFAAQAHQLEAIWREETFADASRPFVERCLGTSLEGAWAATAAWLEIHDPALLKGATTARDRFGLVCRGWLAACSRRAVHDDGPGEVQVWSGPAIAALNHRTAVGPLRRDRSIGPLVRWLCPQEIP